MSLSVHLWTGEERVSIVAAELDSGKAGSLYERPLIVEQTNGEGYGWSFCPRLISS
jgi:hypothetical protein